MYLYSMFQFSECFILKTEFVPIHTDIQASLFFPYPNLSFIITILNYPNRGISYVILIYLMGHLIKPAIMQGKAN